MKYHFVIALYILLAIIPCRLRAQEQIRPADFNLIFKYGIYAKKILNTIDSTYTWDMVFGPSVVIKLTLMSQELDSIYMRMKEINLESYPDTFSPPNPRLISKEGVRIVAGDPIPHQSFYIEVHIGNVVKSVWWDHGLNSESVEAKNLWRFVKYVTSIIALKPEYKELPPPRGGYM